MSQSRCRRTQDGEPFIVQDDVNGHPMSWNPDDERFYVHAKDGETLATFKDWRNAVYYAKTH